jgi:STE24 endopeptidase
MLLAVGLLTAGIAGHAPKLAIAWALLPSLWLFALPPVNAMYRRYEFEADRTAAEGASAAAMAAALRRLTRHNANTPQPDRWYERVYHTHPAISERLSRLDDAA